jgi:hypothetical protein
LIQVKDRPAGGLEHGRRGTVKVESSPGAKQQAPQASDLDAARKWKSRRRQKVKKTPCFARHRPPLANKPSSSPGNAVDRCNCPISNQKKPTPALCHNRPPKAKVFFRPATQVARHPTWPGISEAGDLQRVI